MVCQFSPCKSRNSLDRCRKREGRLILLFPKFWHDPAIDGSIYRPYCLIWKDSPSTSSPACSLCLASTVPHFHSMFCTTHSCRICPPHNPSPKYIIYVFLLMIQKANCIRNSEAGQAQFPLTTWCARLLLWNLDEDFR